jgi:hypothetical protein
VGATYETLKRANAVWGAFAIDDRTYDVWSLPVGVYAANMKPTKSKGPSRGKVGVVERRIFESGHHIATVTEVPNRETQLVPLRARFPIIGVVPCARYVVSSIFAKLAELCFDRV